MFETSPPAGLENSSLCDGSQALPLQTIFSKLTLVMGDDPATRFQVRAVHCALRRAEHSAAKKFLGLVSVVAQWLAYWTHTLNVRGLKTTLRGGKHPGFHGLIF